MRTRTIWSSLTSLVLLACSSSSNSVGTPNDAGPDTAKIVVDASHRDSAKPPVDAGHDATEKTESGVDAGPTAPTRMDLLFVVDNSPSMGDKQQNLSQAIPTLLNGLLNPACLDASGTPVPAAMQPTSTASCPAGTTRDFPPLFDAHIGVISTSLGTFGANGCADTANVCPGGGANTSANDHAHLLSRTDPCSGGVVATYQNGGFVAWDPKMQLSPAGESVLGDGTSPGLVQSVQSLIVGAGQLGCGFESQNEAWYRFLVDPAPYETIALSNNTVVTTGTDTTLLQQRAAFLRPDSLLLVVLLTDKTDASIKESSTYPLVAQLTANGLPFHLPHASSACTTSGPTDPCCYSCGEAPPTGCTADPACTSSPVYTDTDENVAIRTFGLEGQKARYGIEFFYPTSRYVSALTSASVANEQGMMVENPIFAGSKRPANRVFYAAITGVPWQLIARDDASGTPDLVNGVSTLDPKAIGGFKTSAELALHDPAGNTFWDDIAGDPANYVAALSPYMQESTTPRTGTDPITGTMMAPPTASSGANAINGHEWTIPTPPGDIEYACVFPKATPVDCSVMGTVCDCSATSTTNPLCSPNPNDGMNPTLQTGDKAYPGVKHLAIAEGLGSQGIVASICAAGAAGATQPGDGYLPAAQTIIAQLKPAIRE